MNGARDMRMRERETEKKGEKERDTRRHTHTDTRRDKQRTYYAMSARLCLQNQTSGIHFSCRVDLAAFVDIFLLTYFDTAEDQYSNSNCP